MEKRKIAHSPIKDEDFIEEMDKMSILQKCVEASYIHTMNKNGVIYVGDTY